MAENSSIKWCDATVNFWWGCTKVSPGCAHCYADTLAHRFGKDIWGPGKPREDHRAGARKLALKLNAQAVRWAKCECGFESKDWPKEALFTGESNVATCPACGHVGLTPRRPRVFCASMSDWLDDEVPIEWLAFMLETIQMTQNLDWLLLSKRPENWRNRLEKVASVCGDAQNGPDPWSPAAQWLDGDAPANVWVGATVEDQKRADERIPALLKIPARVRFLSCEPLLEAVNLAQWLPKKRPAVRPSGERFLADHFYLARCVCGWIGTSEMLRYVSHGDDGECYCPACDKPCDDETSGIDWVICGGESGRDPRSMHPAWARSLRDQCQAAGTAFLFKQWGEWAPSTPDAAFGNPRSGWQMIKGHPHVAKLNDLRPGAGAEFVAKVGKKAAGRLLEGRTWDEFPQLTAEVTA